MKNLNLSKVLSNEQIVLVCTNGLSKLSENEQNIIKDKLQKINDKYNLQLEDGYKVYDNKYFDLLYDLTSSIDVSNPYVCYDYIQKSISESDIESDRSKYRNINSLIQALSFQFGDNWIQRLIEEKHCIEKLLSKKIEYSKNNKEQLNSLILDIDFDLYELQISNPKFDIEEDIKENEYKVCAIENYIKCNF